MGDKLEIQELDFGGHARGNWSNLGQLWQLKLILIVKRVNDKLEFWTKN